MRLRSLALSLAAAALLPACTAEGQYVIRGRIRAQRPDGVGIIGNASAVVTGGREPTPVWVGRDGAFEAKHRFGMVWVLFVPLGDGFDPHIEFSAPGYRKVRVRVRGESAPEGVTRRPCDPPEKGSHCFDVVLAPEVGQRPVPVRPRRCRTSRRCRRGARGRRAHA
jgi:hypothetical protein